MGGKESKQFPITTDEALKRGSIILPIKNLTFMKKPNVIDSEFFNCIYSD